MLFAILVLTGCANLKPVQPWEKGNLAKPEMALDSDAHEFCLKQHLYPSKEAAMGGYSVGGGGCGCN